MTLADRQCTFCDLIHGAGEASMCYEDGLAVAFMDIQPVNAGHVLVVPRRHFERLEDLPAELAMHLFRVSATLVPAVKKVSGAKGINIVVNSGRVAGQDEPRARTSRRTGWKPASRWRRLSKPADRPTGKFPLARPDTTSHLYRCSDPRTWRTARWTDSDDTRTSENDAP